MSMFSLIWKADALVKKVNANIERGMGAAGAYLQRKVVESFGSPIAMNDPDLAGYVMRRASGKKITAKQFRQAQHSAPGDPPYRQTSRLANSITFQVTRDTRPQLLLGSSLKPQKGSAHSYAFWLERGGTRLKARPYLRPAVLNNKKAILRLIAHG